MNNTIWCIGKNYKLHALEMNQQVESFPIVFIKSFQTIVKTDQPVHLPIFSHQVQYETEIALLFSSNLEFSHITVALDLTARDIQNQMKQKGLPWTFAKSFKESCPLGNWKTYNKNENVKFHLTVNGQIRQEGRSQDMVFSPEDLRKHLIDHFPVTPGDIVLTGTPEGISDAHSQDLAELFLENEKLGQFLIL